jgi:hypothetical protein
MIVSSVTWLEKQHNLFDYQSNVVIFCKFQVSGALKIYRELDDIKPSSQDLSAQVLVCIKKSANGFKILPVNTSKLWTIVKPVHENIGHLLKQGQYIKLGRKMLKVKVLDAGFEECKGLRKMNLNEENTPDGEACRICLNPKTEQNDPLFAPCSCKGSVKYAHVSCFQDFAKPKISITRGERWVKYSLQTLKCEISRCDISRKTISKSLIFDIVNAENLKPPFMIFEFNNKQKEYYLLVVFFSCGNESFTIGRGKGMIFL